MGDIDGKGNASAYASVSEQIEKTGLPKASYDSGREALVRKCVVGFCCCLLS